MNAYILVSLLTGSRTEELRALTWDHVVLDGSPGAEPPVPPHIAVWRSVRAGGDTKTKKSRRTLALPTRCVEALKDHWVSQGWGRCAAADAWQEHGLRRALRLVLVKVEGLTAAEWTPRELRHSFVSMRSDSGVSLEEISRLVGHSSTAVTEEVYRKQIRPVIQTGAVVMDELFKRDPDR